MVRQQLHRDDRQQRVEEVERPVRDLKRHVGHAFHDGVVFRGDRQNRTAASLNLAHVAHDLVADVALGSSEDGHHAIADQGQRPVFHLARRAFDRRDVGDLLEFEGPFQRHVSVRPSTHEEEQRRTTNLLRQLDHLRFEAQNHLGAVAHAFELGGDLGDAHAGHLLDLRDVKREQDQRHHLRRVGLGAGDRNLGARLRVDRAVALAGDARTHHVHDAERADALFLAEAQGGQRVGRLAALADEDGERARREHGIAIPKLAGIVTVCGQTQQLFEQMLGHHSGVQSRAASDDVHAIDLVPDEVAEHLVQPDVALVVDAARDDLAHHVRLLVDLLEHEVLVTALFGGGHIPFDVLGLERQFASVAVGEHDGVLRHRRDRVLFEDDDVPGVGQQGGDVAGQKILVLAHAEHERARVAHGHDLAGFALGHDHKRVRAAKLLDAAAHGLLQRYARGILRSDHVGGDFGVGFGPEFVPILDQFGLQFEVVLDDAVVDDGDLLVPVEMGVGVGVGRPAVGGPPRVADGEPALVGPLTHEFAEFAELARPLQDVDARPVQVGDARAVIAAILEPLELVVDDVDRVPLSDVSGDAAHK